MSRKGNLFQDEYGFTTASMVLSLLITLALIFTAAQVYRINSASAEVQDVADAAALSAEGQVAEFMIVARFCDATVLSLSLAGIAALGLGVVTLCTPVTATLSEGLIKAGEDIIKARDTFSERAKNALNKLQEALPFFAAACAAAVAHANNDDSLDAQYGAIALLVPSSGELIGINIGEKARDCVEDIKNNTDDIREKAQQAEDAAKEANEAKQVAFMRDCGDNPHYCMYERATALAGMSGVNNPLYSSIDTWTFSVAFERAKHYYANRARNDQPTGNAPDDLARWQLRVVFYEYADELLNQEGYVHETSDSFDANFPHLPKNTDEMRETRLYTDKLFPITEGASADDKSSSVMHAWEGCPGATGAITMHESISYMEENKLATCPVCQFSAASMGKVAAASTSINNGFEYHYAAVAEAADNYEEAIQKAEPARETVKESAGELFTKIIDALKQATDSRIDVSPPGKYGAVSLVVNFGITSTAGGFASSFSESGTLGPRAAVSAATLLDEKSEEGRNVINSLLDGLKQDSGAAVGAVGIVLDLWSHMLEAYSNGVESVVGGIESCLNQISLASASGLGTWAAEKLRILLDTIGLEPAKLKALKPVLVNSAHVASKDSGRFASGLVSIKQRVITHPLVSTDLFSSLLSDAERSAIEQAGQLGDSIEIASIELFGDSGSSIPLTIPLPEKAKQFGLEMIVDVFNRLRSLYAQTTGVRVWE